MAKFFKQTMLVTGDSGLLRTSAPCGCDFLKNNLGHALTGINSRNKPSPGQECWEVPLPQQFSWGSCWLEDPKVSRRQAWPAMRQGHNAHGMLLQC